MPETCIYYRTTGDNFPREHVIPQAFGRFENNLTIFCVCESCNQHFSRELELFLSRDSGEAILRLRYGLKPPSEASEIRNTRLTITITQPGPWRGAKVFLTSDEAGSKLQIEQLPQVAFQRTGEDWVWLTEEQLNEPHVVDAYRGKGTEIQIIGPSEEDWERLREKLKDLGIKLSGETTFRVPVPSDRQFNTQIDYQIDHIITRGIAKIALNYVARIHDAAFALRPDFNELRNYVRYGQVPSWRPVTPTSDPILADDGYHMRQTNGHLITFDWNAPKDAPLAQVSLFNSITHKVLFCKTYSGLWQSLRSGHHFDIETHTVSPLGASPASTAPIYKFR